MGYVEEDDYEGKHGAEHTDYHEDPKFSDVRQRTHAQFSGAGAKQTCETSNASYLNKKKVDIKKISKVNISCKDYISNQLILYIGYI